MTALPPDAERQLIRMRSLEPPVDLVDSIMAEVEATPQIRVGPDFRAVPGLALAAAAVLLALAVLLRLGAPNVGPAPTPVPLDQLPSAGTVQARISIDPGDVPAAFGHGFLWLTNTATGELVRMDPVNGSIASPLAVTEAGSAVPIALTDSALWVSDRRDSTLVELDPASLQERRRVSVDAAISAIAADAANLWLLDEEAEEVLRVDASDGSTTPSIAIQGATSLLVHGGAVWVGNEAGGLVRIDPATEEETGRVDVGVAATDLVAERDSVLVVGGHGEPVVRVDIGSMQVAVRGSPVLAVAAENGRVWAVTASGHLVQLAPGTLQPIAAKALELDAAGTLASAGGSLWTTGLDQAGDAYLLQVTPAP